MAQKLHGATEVRYIIIFLKLAPTGNIWV